LTWNTVASTVPYTDLDADNAEERAVQSPFRKLHHICIVVKDLQRTVEFYQSVGVGPWRDYPKVSHYVELEVPDEAASAELVYKVADLENFQLQLCQPSGADSPQRRFLDMHGDGIYHVGFEVEDLSAGQDAGLGMGLEILSRGRRENGTGFCYFDTRKEAGTILEIRKT
jgi:methylmalonyl-CoA/ethylmalonyl-CoA epimerase